MEELFSPAVVGLILFGIPTLVYIVILFSKYGFTDSKNMLSDFLSQREIAAKSKPVLTGKMQLFVYSNLSVGTIVIALNILFNFLFVYHAKIDVHEELVTKPYDLLGEAQAHEVENCYVLIIAFTTFNIWMAFLKMYYKIWVEVKGSSRGVGPVIGITLVADMLVQAILLVEVFGINQ